MEWSPVGWSVCLPLVILHSVIKSRRSFLLAPAHLGGPETTVKWLWCGGGTEFFYVNGVLLPFVTRMPSAYENMLKYDALHIKHVQQIVLGQSCSVKPAAGIE